MKSEYEILEKKYIKKSLDELKKRGYKCRLKIKELQYLIIYLTFAYADDVVDLIDNDENAKLYFNRVQSEMSELQLEFLLGYYRARKTSIIMVNMDTKEQKTSEFSYYPIIINKKDGSKKQVVISHVDFEAANGKLLNVPKEFNNTKATTLEELYQENKDSEDFDLTFIRNYLMINEMDIAARNIIIDCIVRRIMGINELDLEVKLKRATTFIKSMACNIDNFTKDSVLIELIQNIYQELKQNDVTNGDNGLKKKKK